MNVVNTPLSQPELAGSASAARTARAMEIGQHIIAALLTTIGVIRAVGVGTPAPAAIVAGLAILAWHTAGAILPARTPSRRAAVWWLIGFAVIWIAAVAVSSEFVWVAFLLWLLAGHLLPTVWGLTFSALVFGPAIGGVFAFAISRGYLQLLHDAAERERLVASLRLAQQEMSALQDELLLAQRHSGAVAERTRISRDIHDTVAQGLSSIRLLAHAGAARSQDPEATDTLTRVESLAGDSLTDVRRIIAALAPAELEAAALAAALRRVLDRAAEESGLATELHVDESLPRLPTAVEVALLRTAQSALANVRLHAQATRVVLSLIDDDTTVRLDLIDDGVGFDVAAWESGDQGRSTTSGFGLRFMRTRLRELGGGLDIESAPGEGTALSAHLPIAPAPTRRAAQETP